MTGSNVDRNCDWDQRDQQNSCGQPRYEADRETDTENHKRKAAQPQQPRRIADPDDDIARAIRRSGPAYKRERRNGLPRR